MDLIEMLAEILKIDPALVSQYSSQGPIQALFFLFFFPTLFLIIFVWVIGRKWGGKIFGLLISVAVYAFIVFQGWYTWFVWLSQFWIYLLIFLGFIWFITSRPGKGGGGQAVQGRGFFTGLSTQVAGRAWKRVSGEEKDLVKTIEAQLKMLKDLKPGDRDLANLTKQIEENLRLLREMVSIGGVKVGGDYDRLLNEFKKIADEKGVKVSV
jgi:hypothetical protein